MTPRYERFFAKVDRDGPLLVLSLGRCWAWTGSTDSLGRGRMSPGARGGSPLTSSRVSWEIHYGQIRYGLCVLHRCDNPSCVNPRHLYLGTQKQNIQDSITRGRFKGYDNLARGRRKKNGTSDLDS